MHSRCPPVLRCHTIVHNERNAFFTLFLFGRRFLLGPRRGHRRHHRRLALAGRRHGRQGRAGGRLEEGAQEVLGLDRHPHRRIPELLRPEPPGHLGKIGSKSENWFRFFLARSSGGIRNRVLKFRMNVCGARVYIQQGVSPCNHLDQTSLERI